MFNYAHPVLDLPDPPKARYKVFRIPKKNKRERKIYAPYGEYKRWLKKVNPILTILAIDEQPISEEGGKGESFSTYLNKFSGVEGPEKKKLLNEMYKRCPVHGFMPGRNPVTAAIPHIGAKFTLSIDLEDFFDSVSIKKIGYAMGKLNNPTRLASNVWSPLCPTGVTRQGLPTSPSLANIASYPLDTSLMLFCGKYDIIYTRYADDLSFSFDSLEERLNYRDNILDIINQAGWKVNKKKTRLQWGGKDGTWTREIVGVGVNHEKVLPLRTARRKVRGLDHHMKFNTDGKNEKLIQIWNGMHQWVKCKTPFDAGQTYKFVHSLAKEV